MPKQPKDSSANYVWMIVFVFLMIGSFMLALMGVYFAGVGLYFGEAVVEGDVFTQRYRFECNNANETASTCTNISTTPTGVFTDYEEFRTDLNATVPLYLAATTIIFSLLGLVFLFLALKSAGLFGGKGTSSKRDEM